jgi:hypothetical protein
VFDGLDDYDGHVMDRLPDLMHLFPAVSPLTVYRYELRHYIALARAVDAQRKEAK